MGRQTFVPSNGLSLGALDSQSLGPVTGQDSQSLGPGSMPGQTFVSLFFPLHLCHRRTLFIHHQVPMPYMNMYMYMYMLDVLLYSCTAVHVHVHGSIMAHCATNSQEVRVQVYIPHSRQAISIGPYSPIMSA